MAAIPVPPFRSRFNGLRSGVGGRPPFLGEDPRGGGVVRRSTFFASRLFFVAGVSVTHPGHLTFGRK